MKWKSKMFGFKLNYFYYILIFSIIFTSCENSNSPENQDANDKLTISLDKIGDSLTTNIIVGGTNISIPGAVIGVINSETNFNYLKSFGKSDLFKNIPFNRSDEIRIGTITQTFISTIVFQLLDEGKLSLNDPINKFLKVPHSGSIITVRHLLNHRSGIADFIDSVKFYQSTNPKQKWTKEQLINFAFNSKPLITPDIETKLSKTNYLLLGLIIENLTNLDLKSVIESRILNQLNLVNTKFENESKFNSANFSNAYILNPNKVFENITDKNDYSWAWSSSNMTSNSHDLMKWASLLGNGSVVSNNSFNLMKNFNSDYIDVLTFKKMGLGIMKIGNFIGFSGDIDGYSISMYYLPNKKTTVYIFTNTNNNNDILFLKISNLLYPGIKFN
jgi:D-alanyl-D-alanine carboxypeptidase